MGPHHKNWLVNQYLFKDNNHYTERMVRFMAYNYINAKLPIDDYYFQNDRANRGVRAVVVLISERPVDCTVTTLSG